MRVSLDWLAEFIALPPADELVERLELGCRSAQEMARVGKALEGLPALRRANDEARLSSSHVSELVRIVTPETEGEWVERASALTVRGLREEIERHKEEETSLAQPRSTDKVPSSSLPALAPPCAVCLDTPQSSLLGASNLAPSPCPGFTPSRVIHLTFRVLGRNCPWIWVK